MSRLIKTFAAAAAFMTLAPAAVAQPHGRVDLARYDAAAAPTLGQQLVLCDLASYFGSRPDLNAQRVYLRRDDNRYDPTFPTAILRGGQWYDEDLERAYVRHLQAGRITSAEAYAVRSQYGAEMERVFDRPGRGEERFFTDQARFCRGLARASRGAWR